MALFKLCQIDILQSLSLFNSLEQTFSSLHSGKSKYFLYHLVSFKCDSVTRLRHWIRLTIESIEVSVRNLIVINENQWSIISLILMPLEENQLRKEFFESFE